MREKECELFGDGGWCFEMAYGEHEATSGCRCVSESQRPTWAAAQGPRQMQDNRPGPISDSRNQDSLGKEGSMGSGGREEGQGSFGMSYG